MVAIEALKEQTEIIFVSGLNLHLTPEIVQDAMASDEADGPTPIIAVFDQEIQKLLGIVPYFDMKDPDGFKKVNTALADHRGVAVDKSSMARRPQPETWKDTRGRSIQATYVNSTDKEVTLRLAGGNLSTIPLTKLNEASQKRVAELASKK